MLGVRLRGIDWLLPLTHLDGSVIVAQVEALHDGRDDIATDKRLHYYPLLLARAASVLPDPRTEEVAAPDTAAHVARSSATWIQARRVSAVLSMLLAPLTYLLARRFLGGGAAVLAAGLVATSLLLMTFGTQARPHGLAAVAILAAVLSALRLRERGDRTAFVLVGLTGGAAVGALHYGVFAFTPIVIAWWFRRRAAHGAWILVSIVLAGAIIVWCYPFHFVPGRGFLTLGEAETGTTFNLSGQLLHFGLFNGSGFPVIPETLWSYDPTMLVLGALGSLFLLARVPRLFAADRRLDVAIVLAHAVPYTIVIGLYQNTWERFVIQLLPYVAVVGAYGLWRVRAAVSSAATTPWVIAPLVLPAALCVNLAALRAAPSTYDQAVDWIAEEMPADALVAAVNFDDLPLMHAPAELEQNGKRKWSSMWLRYELELPEEERARHPRFRYLLPAGRPHEMLARLSEDPLGYFREVGSDYVLVPVMEPGTLPYIDGIRERLRELGPPVWTASPARDGEARPAPIPNLRIDRAELARPFVRRLLQSRRLGATLEMYRLP